MKSMKDLRALVQQPAPQKEKLKIIDLAKQRSKYA